MRYFSKSKDSELYVFHLLKVFTAYKTTRVLFGKGRSQLSVLQEAVGDKVHTGQLLICETGLESSLSSCPWAGTQLMNVAHLPPTSNLIVKEAEDWMGLCL